MCVCVHPLLSLSVRVSWYTGKWTLVEVTDWNSPTPTFNVTATTVVPRDLNLVYSLQTLSDGAHSHSHPNATHSEIHTLDTHTLILTTHPHTHSLVQSLNTCTYQSCAQSHTISRTPLGTVLLLRENQQEETTDDDYKPLWVTKLPAASDPFQPSGSLCEVDILPDQPHPTYWWSVGIVNGKQVYTQHTHNSIHTQLARRL